MSRHLRPAFCWQKRLTTDENQSDSYLLPCSPDRSLLPLLISEVKKRSLDSSFIFSISAQLTAFTNYGAGRVSVLCHFLRSGTSWSCRWTVYCIIPQLALYYLHIFYHQAIAHPSLLSLREPLLLSLRLPFWWKPHRTRQQHSCLFYNLIAQYPAALRYSLCHFHPACHRVACIHTPTRGITHPFIISPFLASFSWQSILHLIVRAFCIFYMRKNVQKQDDVSHLGDRG